MFLRRIGYWSGGYSIETHLPNPYDFVDPDWEAAIEARGPFDPVRQREPMQLLLAVGEHVGGDADAMWARLVTPEPVDSQEQPGELGSGDPHDA